ncbi:MAG: RNase P subunit p30 family protein [Promethearchaeota archaeon]
MSYFEARLKVNFNNFEEVRRKIEFCELLGIKNLILEPLNNSKKIKVDDLKKAKNLTKSKVYFRFNLRVSNPKEFKKIIKAYNNFPYILSLETDNKEVQIQAAKDSRIDILSFSELDIIKTVTKGVISLVKQNNAFIEFSLSPLMTKNKVLQSKTFRNLYRFTQLILNLRPNYIISGNFSELYNLRNPRNLLSICHTLLEMPLNDARKGFSTNVQLLLDRVGQRVDKNVIMDGVKIVKGGD